MEIVVGINLRKLLLSLPVTVELSTR